MSQPLPLRWLQLQDLLEQRAAQCDRDGWYVKKDILREIALGEPYFLASDADEFNLFLKYVQEAGVVLRFEAADDCIVINANRMVTALADIALQPCSGILFNFVPPPMQSKSQFHKSDMHDFQT